jgi:DNA (cytosine-5)-methyltransferase 1
VDVDESCSYAYEVNNDAKFIKADVASMDSAKVAELFESGKLRLLAGCAPCQPFSTYSRKGRNKNYEEQWPLVKKFGSLIHEIQPELVTMENVPQLADHDVFSEFLTCLDGYSIWWDVVECERFGVPQTRKRLVLLASKLGCEGLELRSTHRNPVSVKATIGKLGRLKAGEMSSLDPLHVSSRLSPINLRRIKASKPGGTWRDWPKELQAECHLRSTGATYPSVYGRMEWSKAAPTMTTQCFGYGNGRFGHPEQNRAISLREAAMLQTFPKKYKFVRTKKEIVFSRLGRLIGNAVPVRLGEVIGRTLVEHVGKYTS